MTEIEPNQIVILASVPVISHSLFRTGSERINLTQNIKIEIDKNLVRDKPLEFVTKTVNIRTDFVKKCLKNQFSLDPVIEILPEKDVDTNSMFNGGRRALIHAAWKGITDTLEAEGFRNSIQAKWPQAGHDMSVKNDI